MVCANSLPTSLRPVRIRISSFDDTGYLLAVTALLVHVVSLDGEPSAIEKRKLHSLIESRFNSIPVRRII